MKQKTYAAFDGRGNLQTLPELCLQLLSEQKKAWDDLREGCELFGRTRERKIQCTGFSVRLQYNPGRMRSSTAPVGDRNRNERPCFLCLDHLPQAQKGILYRGEYLILCNPMPVFSSHFTVSHPDHRPQTITEHVDNYLQLIADLGPGWAVLYNGPRCGASAPDHLHFQVIPSGQLPIEKEMREEKRVTLMTQINDGVVLYRVKELGRETMVLEGDHSITLENAFKRFLDALKKVLLVDEEPMVNIAGYHEERRWRLVIFPRRKHRPDAFFREGDARMVVSPGVIDMAGFLITPVERDFDRLDAAAVEGIYKEVSLEGKTVERAMDALY